MMALKLSPLPSPACRDTSFGRIALLSGEDPITSDMLISDKVFEEIERALYTHGILVFPNVCARWTEGV